MKELNLVAALPEIVLLTVVCVVLLADLFAGSRRWLAWALSLAGIAVVAAVTAIGHAEPARYALHGMMVDDAVADWSRWALLFLTFGVLLYGYHYLAERGLFKGETFALILFALLGMQVMVSANHFLTLYVGLEILSLSLYALIAMNREQRTSIEAAMKYFVLGALASGLLLYGISMVYGAVGTLYLPEVAARLASPSANVTLAGLGLVFIVGGIAFKLGAVPFHMWVPDIYQGSPLLMTMLVATAPKMAAAVFAFRILGQGLDVGLIGEQWPMMLMVLAVLSMGLGNVVAIAQSNLKRMLAYSAIAHMGYLLLGLLARSPEGYAATLFYAVSYGLMSLAAFGLLVVLSRGLEVERLEQLKGLARTQPWTAFLLLITFFSLAGIPPTVGFFAKLSVLRAAVNAGYPVLAVIAVLFSLVGAFYYLRVVKTVYFDEPAVGVEPLPQSSCVALVTVNALLLLLLGIVPQWLVGVLSSAVEHSLRVG